MKSKRTENRKKNVSKMRWKTRCMLEASLSRVGRPWDLLGASLGPLEVSWIPLGYLLGIPWEPLGTSWAHMGVSWGLFGHLLGIPWEPPGPPGSLLRISSKPLGFLLESFRDLLGTREPLGASWEPLGVS